MTLEAVLFRGDHFNKVVELSKEWDTRKKAELEALHRQGDSFHAFVSCLQGTGGTQEDFNRHHADLKAWELVKREFAEVDIDLATALHEWGDWAYDTLFSMGWEPRCSRLLWHIWAQKGNVKIKAGISPVTLRGKVRYL